jgi:hypothetical protein
MKPEDAFLAIADGIQKIPDPMVQSQVALQLFGKSAGELLPAIKEGFRDAANGAMKMSADTIKSLEAAQDAWEKLGNDVTIVTGNMIAELMKLPTTTQSAFSGITGSVAGFKNFVTNAWQGGIGSAFAWSSAVEQAAKSAGTLAPAVAPIAPAFTRRRKNSRPPRPRRRSGPTRSTRRSGSSPAATWPSRQRFSTRSSDVSRTAAT